MLNRLKTLHNRGDTIVEVMIVLAILGLAIGISYSTANRSLLNARQAQENSQASNLVQSQVEKLRTLVADSSQNIFQAGPYCIDQNTDKITSSCDFGSIPYHVDITYDASAQTFKVNATWPDVITAGSPDNLTTYYRVYAPTSGTLPGGGGDFPQCASGSHGTPPNCIPDQCPSGESGTYPNCTPTQCPSGTQGTPPDCTPISTGQCQFPEIGTPPDCHIFSL